MQEVRFRVGETIFAEDDPSDHGFKIVSGKVEISLHVPGTLKRGRKEVVHTAGPGEIIGEMSVIEKGPRSATAVAIEPTVCLAFTAEEILDVLEHDPHQALAYIRTLIRRLRHTNKAVSMSAARRG
ncbi:MAG TPA: cyclic nucleotide-binding domain-containing protein [Thermohalobaculum sp.]|nr:cyclic nucleotide-binding domain-containing protein [Thermohalobaculum sp.]